MTRRYPYPPRWISPWKEASPEVQEIIARRYPGLPAGARLRKRWEAFKSWRDPQTGRLVGPAPRTGELSAITFHPPRRRGPAAVGRRGGIIYPHIAPDGVVTDLGIDPATGQWREIRWTPLGGEGVRQVAGIPVDDGLLENDLVSVGVLIGVVFVAIYLLRWFLCGE